MENKENLKKALIQFIKFGTVGAINTVLSYAITNGAYYLLHLHEQISNIIAFVIALFISFPPNYPNIQNVLRQPFLPMNQMGLQL